MASDSKMITCNPKKYVLNEVLERLKSINIDPFINANSSIADTKLKEMRGKLKDSNQRIEELLATINSKIGDNE